MAQLRFIFQLLLFGLIGADIRVDGLLGAGRCHASCDHHDTVLGETPPRAEDLAEVRYSLSYVYRN